jgi:hypothetical protein
MGENNVGAINYGSGTANVSDTAVGRKAAVYHVEAGGPVTTAQQFGLELDALRRALVREQAEATEPGVELDDTIAAINWLRHHLTEPAKPADAERRLGALRRLHWVWSRLVQLAAGVPAGVVAGWIVEAMK